LIILFSVGEDTICQLNKQPEAPVFKEILGECFVKETP
jgi:hypothetical protein